MLGTEAEANQRGRADFSVVGQFLVGLKLFHGADGIVTPLTVDFAFVVAFVGERLLDFLVAVRIRVGLVRGTALSPGCPAVGGGPFMRSRLCRRGGGQVNQKRREECEGANPSHTLQSSFQGE